MQHLPAEQQRFEEFYSWSRNNKGKAHRESLFNKLENGEYADESIQRHWWTWQMASNPERLQSEMAKSN